MSDNAYTVQVASASRILFETTLADAQVALVLFREMTRASFHEPVCLATLTRTRVEDGEPSVRILHTFDAATGATIPPIPGLPFDEDRPFAEAPKDGRTVLARSLTPYRWRPYRAGAPVHLMKLGGRWQVMNAFGAWENAQSLPASYVVPAAVPSAAFLRVQSTAIA